MIPSKLQFRARSLMHVLPVLPLLAFIACSATTKDDRVVRLPDAEPKQEVACQEHDDCSKEERCGDDEWCQSLWRQYSIKFVSISIPEVDAAQDEDGTAPDPSCYLSVSGGPAGMTDRQNPAVDIYQGSLEGGGEACLPNTWFKVGCVDANDVGPHKDLGQFCWSKEGECAPVPREVLLDGLVEVTLDGGVVDGVKVKLAFEPMGPCKER